MVRVAGGVVKFDLDRCKIGQVTDRKDKDLAAVRPAEDTAGRMASALRRLSGRRGRHQGRHRDPIAAPSSPGSHSVRFRANLTLLCCDETTDYSIPGLAKLPAPADVLVSVRKDPRDLMTVVVPVEGTIELGLPPQR